MLPLVQTTYHTPRKPKPFAWSWTKIKNFEACPKRHFHVDIAKDFKEEESEQLKHGDIVHKILEQRIAHGTELPPLHKEALEPWASWLLSVPGAVHVEQMLAITNDFQSCGWRDWDRAWFRAKIDALKLMGAQGLVVDWKTGKVKEDVAQLMLNAAVAFIHYPELQKVTSMFVWLAESATSEVKLERSQLPELWANLWPRIEAVRKAHETHDYPPTPGRLCQNWCPVKSCPHNGERHG